jgi:hypothetical protein
MFTDKQYNKLTTINFVHEQLFPWVRHHMVDVKPENLTEIQYKTLLLIADMLIAEQKQYVIIDDMLVKTPTDIQNYIKIQGEWQKRKELKINR